MKNLFILLFVMTNVGCYTQPILHVTTVDGITHQPIAKVKVEYYGDADSILSRATPQNRRIILGFTELDGTILINTYPDRERTQLYFLKRGYAPACIQWRYDEQSNASLTSPYTQDPRQVIGKGQGGTLVVAKPVMVELYRYKPGVVPDTLHPLPGKSPDGDN